MEIAIWVVCGTAGLLLLFGLIGGYCMYRFAIRRDDKRTNPYWDRPLKKPDSVTEEEFEKMREGEDLLKSKMCEFYSMRSRDGLRLVARYYRHPSERGIFLMVHGYRSSSLQDFSAAIPAVWGMGYSLFMIDQRSMGRSEGKAIGFGVKERCDVIDWANYLKERRASGEISETVFQKIARENAIRLLKL